jgi:hypothetical protein
MTPKDLSKLLTFLLVAAAMFDGKAAIANPPQDFARHYSKAELSIDIGRPAALVWRRVGGFCDIQTWGNVACRTIRGNDSDVGSVRELMGTLFEVLTSRTASSYSYAAVDMPSSPQIFIHGAVEVRDTGPGTSRILYTLLYDDTSVQDVAERDRDLARRTAFLKQGLERMKAISEHE